MVFKAEVRYIEEYNVMGEPEVAWLFVAADTMREAVSKISDYFGEDCVDKISIEPISPNEMLLFENAEGLEIFNKAASYLEENTLW